MHITNDMSSLYDYKVSVDIYDKLSYFHSLMTNLSSITYVLGTKLGVEYIYHIYCCF